jgi:uncharacterized repeat protein (TIGR01451 family)
MNRRFDRLPRAAAAAVCAVVLLLSQTAGRSAERQIVFGNLRKAAIGLQPVGPLASTNRMTLAIGLPLRDPVGLTNFLRQIYDPASPNYRQYLKPDQFTEKFGPTASDYQALIAFAKTNHLNVTGQHPNRIILDVEASVADIERTFHVGMQVYQHPTENRTFYGPDRDPSVDLGVPLLHIDGLDNFLIPKPLIRHKTPNPNVIEPLQGTGSGPEGTFLGYDFRDAYVPGVTLTGTGQKIALFELDGYFASDITNYETKANLPNVTLTNILIDGFLGVPFTGGGDGEVSLDIEMDVCMAPGASLIMVYEATNGLAQPIVDALDTIATDDVANQISSSWLIGDDPVYDVIYFQYAAQGQSFYQASGDNGAYVWSVPDQQRADDPNITLVGATTLTTSGPLGDWVSETVWNWNSTGEGTDASGGGISPNYTIPVWQQGISMLKNGGSSVFRDSPDVALTGDNIFIIANNGIAEPGIGGTSCAAPLWAAFTSLVNEQAASVGKPPIGFLNPTIYSICKGPLYPLTMHDIITGNNTNAISPNQFYAVPGYDLCTGWGTPTGSNLINSLAPLTLSPVLAVFSNSISGGNGNGVIDFDECNNLQVTLTNEGNGPATGITGILYSTTPGVIVAQPNVAFPPLPAHTSGVSIGTFTISTVPTFICGTPVNLTLIVKSDQVIQTNLIELSSGILGPPTSIFSTVPVSIPNNPSGISSPIVVNGLDSVGKITVSTYITALQDEGLVLQLIAPNGVSVLLSQNNGNTGQDYGVSCSPAGETTFDDAASQAITLGTPPFLGSFQPQQPLSTFNLYSGTNLNGVWQLNVVDNLVNDTATLNCWSLNISPEVCTDGGGECPGADLSIAMTAVPSIVLVNSNLVFNLIVSNAGPSAANNVVIAQTLPVGVGFVTTSNYPGVSVSQSGSISTGEIVNLSLGTLPVYGTGIVAVVTVPTIPGLATSVATIGSTSTDPNPNNNTASATADVTLPSADLAVTITASPSVLLQGGVLTYSIVVTNNGPFAATSVTLNNTLPPNVNFISASTSQGSIFSGGAVVELGTLDPGSNALVTIVVSPTTTGNITAISDVTLSPLEIDPITANNQASVTVTVGPSADLGVSGYFSPPTILSGASYSNIATVFNNGPSQATGVVFSQTIPGGASFVSSSASGVVVTNGIINWNVGTMASGASLSITNVLQAPTLLAGVQSVSLSSTLTVFGQPGDANTNNNVVTLQALVEPPTITIVPVNAVLISGSSDGAVAPGQTVQVAFNLQNTGNVNTTNVVATLQSTGGVTLPSPSFASYGEIAAGAPPVGRQFSFTANGTNGGTVVATLQLTDGSANLGTVAFTFNMPVVTTFWSSARIDIPSRADVSDGAIGPANPYPSLLTVSNVTGFVSDVSVTFSNMSHQYPHDIAILLVGPQGQDVALMVNAGDYPPAGMVNQTLILDDAASNALPALGAIVSGTYRPADYTPSYSFSNAPAGPYSTNLSVFSGISPNGVWSLYAYDTAEGDSGGISNGWAVTITTITPVNQEADMAASIVASTGQVTLGNSATFLLSVTNNGPNAASAYLTNILPAGLSFISTSVPQSNYTQNGQVVLYTLGTLNPGSGLTITNVVMANVGGLQTDTIVASSTLPDPNTANNSASASIQVSMPSADVAAGISAAPNPVVVTSNLVYTLVVTNLGPSNALSVTGSFPLGALSFVSASLSQGSFATNGSALQFNFGTVPAGNIADAVVTATSPVLGLLTNSWTVGTSDLDPNPANNSASTVVTVINPTPVIVAGGVALMAQGGNFSNGAINSNETVTVALTLNNIGSAPATNLTATLQANANLTPVTTSQSYGTINPGASGTQSYVFTAQGVPGAAVSATLLLTNGTSSLGSVSFVFYIPTVTNYSQAARIIIPEYGPGQPYPSQIQVSGISGVVSQVTATLNGFSHTFPHDVNVLLADPAGQELFLMAHVGGAYSVTNLTLTFEDSATQTLPAGQLSSGAFLPTAVTPLNPLPGVPMASSATSLAKFNGTNPNGNWSLYVFDDTQGNAGDIVRGWSLGLTTVSTVNPAAQLAAGMIHAPDPVYIGDYLNYLITITNLGPDEATSVVLTDTLPSGEAFSSATQSQGTNSASGGTVTCSFGTIPAGATATATIRVIAQASGTVVNTATVTTASTDLYLADSTTANSATVLAPPISVLEATNYPSGLQLTLLGQSSQTYGVQVSTDLVNWTTLSTNTAGVNGTFIFTDTGTNLPARFYRALRLPQ